MSPILSRLEKSLSRVGEIHVFEDGRKPTYVSLLDLDSKPFWTCEECGLTALLGDLRSESAALLQEARALREKFGQLKKTESKRGRWQIVEVEGISNLEHEGPVLSRILAMHSNEILRGVPFASSMFSFLEGNDAIAKHYGPSNVRLRLQFPLCGELDKCRLFCGELESDYKLGYAVIDDSYLHWAENGSESERIVLVLDCWHPNVTSEERKKILELLK